MKRDRFGNQQEQEIPPPPPPKPQRRQQQEEEEIPPPPPPRTQRQQQQQQEQHQDIPPPPPPRIKQQQQQEEEEVPPPPPPRPRPSSASLRVGGVILGANGSSSSPAVAYLPTTAVASGSPTSPPAVYLPTIALANGSSSSPPAVYLPSTAVANGPTSSPPVVHLPATAVTNGSLSSPPAAYLPTTTVAWNVPGMNSGGDGDGGGGGVANVFSSSSGISLPSSTLAPADQGNVNTGAASKRSKRGVAEFDGWRAKADEILVKAGIGGGGGGGGGAQAWDSKARIGRVAGREDGDGRMNGGQSKTTVAASAMTPRSKRRFAVVCSANFNRSMMAHKLLRENSFQVESYGTGREVRLPGKDVSSPEVFPFGTPYRDIYDTLKGKDEKFFLQNNLLPLVARNATIKAAPERFQEIEGTDMAGFDVVLCFESRVFYLVVEDLQSRDPETFKPLHVVNMSIKDSFEESAAAADNVLELCRTACLLVPKNKVIGIIHSARLDGLFRLEDEAADVLEAFTRKTKRTVLHQVCHV